jgi:hypothetical protein
MLASPSDWDAVRTAAAAVIAQQSALFEQELRLRERAAALAEQEAQLAGRLEEKRLQLAELGRQLSSAREHHREERTQVENQREQADAILRDAALERERVRLLRAKFIKRMKTHWSAARKDVDEKRAEVDRVRRLVDEDAARLRRERVELDKARHELQRSHDRLAAESDRLADERIGLARIRDENEANLAMRERSIAAERNALIEAGRQLESERQDLEKRRVAASNDARSIKDRDGGSDRRTHLAELCDRLAGAEQGWQKTQLDAIDEMERLASDLIDREEHIQERGREFDVLAEKLRQERQSLGRLRDGLERDSAELMLRQWAWQAERNHLRADLDERLRLVQVREEAIPALLQKWRQRRESEIEQLRELVRKTEEQRQESLAESVELRRRGEALHDERQAVEEQAMALEEARQEFLNETDRPHDAAKRMERLRRRWAGRSEAEKRERESIREHLDREEMRLREIESKLDQQRADLLLHERELADRMNDLENERQKAEAVGRAFDASRRSWGEQRRQYDLLLVDLRAEIDHLSRLVGGNDVPPTLRFAA